MKAISLASAMPALLLGTCVQAAEGNLTLSSSDFTAGGRLGEPQVYRGYDCHGGNVSPQLSWSGAPSETQSFALVVHDPDAPLRGGWWHWAVYDLPRDTHSLPGGAGDAQKGLLPHGARQGRSSFGSAAYGGPCPPPGSPHHYHFRLYALKVAHLEVPVDAGAAAIAAAAQAQALASTELVGLYGR
jgi:Raf kinase inhibitor-like YbhB/YbcL family protein